MTDKCSLKDNSPEANVRDGPSLSLTVHYLPPKGFSPAISLVVPASTKFQHYVIFYMLQGLVIAKFTHTHHKDKYTHRHTQTLLHIHMPHLALLPGANKANTSPQNANEVTGLLYCHRLFYVLVPFQTFFKNWSNFTSVFLKISLIRSPLPHNQEAGQFTWPGCQSK